MSADDKAASEPSIALRRLKARLERERAARVAAEALLESKAHELSLLNQELEQRVETRTRQLHSANATALALLEFDHLTGVASRRQFESRIAKSALGSHSDRKLLLMMIDLDGFKSINDTLGHEAGDLVLVTAASRLRAAVRDGDLIARLGGDEFAIVCEELGADTDEDRICERILAAIRAPILYNGHDILVSCSLGAASTPRDATDVDRLHRFADIALHVAKSKGRDRFVRYESDMSVAFEQRHKLTTELRQALADKVLEPYFQPKVDSRTGRASGLEALARWRHPNGSFVAPDLFIALAEDANLIRDLGMQILEATCRATKPWIEAGYIERVAVNLSPRQLDNDDVIDQIASVLQAQRFDPRHLEFEITENYLMTSVEDAAIKLNAIHAFGSSIALDDFGTGYSNLNFLKKLPLDVVKIDKSFVDGIVDNSDDRLLVEAVIRLANAFSLRTVAEGVETAEQAMVLEALGCDELQGYFFSRPMNAADCGLWLRRNHAAALAEGLPDAPVPLRAPKSRRPSAPALPRRA